MKYKRLKTEDLQALGKEFINFLSAAQVTGPDWEKMKKEEPAKAEELLDVFSDMVYERITGKVEYLEHRGEHEIRVFHFSADKIEMVGLQVDAGSGIDLRKNVDGSAWNSGGVKMYHAEKPYSKEKQLEVFEMLEQGCEITDGSLFGLIKGMA